MTNKFDNINKKIGIRIRIERVKRQWSQSKLAEVADLSETYIGNVERGESSPSIDTLAKIADAFGIVLHDLTDITKVDF